MAGCVSNRSAEMQSKQTGLSCKFCVSLKSTINTFITIDCAVVSNCNENMILTADVLSRIAQCERVMNAPCNNTYQSVCTSDSVNELNMSTNIVDADVLLNDDVIDDSESVYCNHDDECDDVGDVNQNAEGTSISEEHDIASSQQVAEEQRKMKPLQAVLNSLKQVKGVLRSMTICYITGKQWLENHSFS